MSTHDYVIDNQSAPAFRADLNSALAAIVTQNAASAAPSVTYANMIWYDTTNNQIKKRNEANSAWVTLGTIDEGAGTFTPSGGSAPPSQIQTVWNTGTDTTESTITAAKLHGKLTDAFNGGTGEPRVQTQAMSGIVAGDNVLFTPVYYASGSVAEEVVPGSVIRAITDGSLRLVVTARRSSSNVSSGFNIYKNGSVVYSNIYVSTSYTDYTTDISFVAGDSIHVSTIGRSSGGTSYYGYVNKIVVKVGTQLSLGVI